MGQITHTDKPRLNLVAVLVVLEAAVVVHEAVHFLYLLVLQFSLSSYHQ